MNSRSSQCSQTRIPASRNWIEDEAFRHWAVIKFPSPSGCAAVCLEYDIGLICFADNIPWDGRAARHHEDGLVTILDHDIVVRARS